MSIKLIPLCFSRSLQIALFSCGFLLAQHGALAQEPPAFTIPHVNSAPDIDGEVKSAEWAQATRVMLDTEFSPTEGTPARVQTEAFIMEDGEALYVAFIAQDPNPEVIRAFYRDRDGIGGTDFSGIALDTFDDKARAFVFLVSPLGVQYDAINDDLTGNEDPSWNALWESQAVISK